MPLNQGTEAGYLWWNNQSGRPTGAIATEIKSEKKYPAT
jgi:hypothetical protein